MATKQQKEWVDARGQKVPVGYVSKYDKARDKAVRRVLAGALKLREQMEAFMRDAIATMDALAGMKESLGEKGNFSARSFDALIEIAIKQQYNVRLDGRVQKARELMLDYATRELSKAGDGAFLLKQMIDAAFKPDRNGFLPRGEINKLLGKTKEKGYTLVPIEVYFNDGKAKIEIGLAKGKKLYDKREDIAKKDMKREAEREFKARF